VNHRDRVYSPLWLANKIASSIETRPGLTVVDPCVGGGALLEAVQARLGPDAILIGTDVDRLCLGALSSTHPTWRLGKVDVTNRRSRAASKTWQSLRQGGVDYVVMNPPFSYRGGAGMKVDFRGAIVRSTPASAFVAIALEELRPREAMHVILPVGSYRGQRDTQLWDLIREDYATQVIRELPRGSFAGIAATSVLVTLRPVAQEIDRPAPGERLNRVKADGCVCVEVVRGRIPTSSDRARVTRGGSPFLHTTDIVKSTLRTSDRMGPEELATEGPFVLLNRVGRFDASKIATAPSARYVLSDCLFGLRPIGLTPFQLAQILRSAEEDLARLSFGTGAPHITTARLVAYLEAIGLMPIHVPASARPGECRCSAIKTNTTLIEPSMVERFALLP
jgi:hypothetical protein